MPSAGIDLTKIDPKSVKIVSTPDQDNGGAIDLTSIDPAKIKMVSMPPPVAAKPEGIEGAAGDAVRGVYAAMGGDGGETIGARVPIIGSLGKNLGERFRAGVDYAVKGGEVPYSVLLQGIRDQEASDQARFASDHPVVNAMRSGAAGLAIGGMPFPGAGMPGLGGAAVRIGGAVTGAGTDTLLRTEDPESVRQAATLGGGIQTAFESLPYVGKVVAPIGRTVANAAGPAGEWLSTKAANIVGGAEEGNFGKYLANRERINQVGAMDQDAVREAVDAGVAGVNADHTELTGKAKELEDTVNAAYQRKQAELVGKTTPLAKAKEMTASLQAQKGYLGALSEQADDALARSGTQFNKQDLLTAIDKIGKGEGVAIGDEAHAALGKLQATRDRIAEQLPDEIPAVHMRSVLQQLRKDVNFDQGSGEFNDTLNGMRKEFSGQISSALKKQVPEYADYMSRMSDLADNLGTMNRYFGDESKALGSLEALRKGGARGQLIQDALQNHAQVNADQSLLSHLDQVNESHALLDRIKGGEDLRSHFFPDEMHQLAEHQANAQMSGELADSVNRLTPARTGSVIRNQGGKIPHNLDRDQLQALSHATGENYPQMIEDKNVFDSFSKASPGGARRAAVGSVVGGAIGHMVGAPIQGAAAGASIGGALDRYGPAVTKGAVDFNASLAEFLANRGVDVQAFAKAVTNSPVSTVIPNVLVTDPQQSKRNAINRRIGK